MYRLSLALHKSLDMVVSILQTFFSFLRGNLTVEKVKT
jgi:hypothetical protein